MSICPARTATDTGQWDHSEEVILTKVRITMGTTCAKDIKLTARPRTSSVWHKVIYKSPLSALQWRLPDKRVAASIGTPSTRFMHADPSELQNSSKVADSQPEQLEREDRGTHSTEERKLRNKPGQAARTQKRKRQQNETSQQNAMQDALTRRTLSAPSEKKRKQSSPHSKEVASQQVDEPHVDVNAQHIKRKPRDHQGRTDTPHAARQKIRTSSASWCACFKATHAAAAERALPAC